MVEINGDIIRTNWSRLKQTKKRKRGVSILLVIVATLEENKKSHKVVPSPTGDGFFLKLFGLNRG